MQINGVSKKRDLSLPDWSYVIAGLDLMSLPDLILCHCRIGLMSLPDLIRQSLLQKGFPRRSAGMTLFRISRN